MSVQSSGPAARSRRRRSCRRRAVARRAGGASRGCARRNCRCVSSPTPRRGPRRAPVAGLAALGLVVAEPDEIFTPASLIATSSPRAATRPSAHPSGFARGFRRARIRGEDAVVIGDARETFTYDNLNRAFRLIQTARNFSLWRATAIFSTATRTEPRCRRFRRRAGICGREAGRMCSASRRRSFFIRRGRGAGRPGGPRLMIGDDAEADIGGAMRGGPAGALVRTGKYRAGQEKTLAIRRPWSPTIFRRWSMRF